MQIVIGLVRENEDDKIVWKKNLGSEIASLNGNYLAGISIIKNYERRILFELENEIIVIVVSICLFI